MERLVSEGSSDSKAPRQLRFPAEEEAGNQAFAFSPEKAVPPPGLTHSRHDPARLGSWFAAANLQCSRSGATRHPPEPVGVGQQPVSSTGTKRALEGQWSRYGA